MLKGRSMVANKLEERKRISENAVTKHIKKSNFFGNRYLH